MSGIIGVWNLKGRPVAEILLTRMTATLAHRGPDWETVWIDGPVGFSCRQLRVTPEALTETQPLVHTSGIVILFDGRLDNREELLASLKTSPEISAGSSDSRLALAAYDRFGDRFPEHLNGDFALGLYDTRRQQLLLVRDALGVRPLHYYRTGDLFLFASEIKAILAHPQVSPRCNDDMLAQFLLRFPGDDQGLTFFEGVSSLLPGHMAILTRQGFVTKRYWDFDVSRKICFRSFPEYVEAFRHHFDEAVRRRLRSAYPVAVSVSGGLDSSSLFCLAETLRRRAPKTYPPLLGISYTSTDGSLSDERAFISAIEQAYGIQIKQIPLRRGFLDGCKKAIWHSEVPLVDEFWSNTRRLLHTTRQQGARVLVTGAWGDQMLFDQAYLVDLFNRLALRKVWAHLKEFGRWQTEEGPGLSRWFRRRFLLDLVKYHVPPGLLPLLRRIRAGTVRDTPHRSWFTEKFRDRIRQCASRRAAVKRSFAAAHARSIYAEARSRYHVTYMEWINKVASMYGLETAFPFLDRDLISFLMGITGEMQTWKGVPKAILREAMGGVVPDAIVRRNWKGDYTHVVNEGMEQEYPQLLQLLQDGMLVKLGYAQGDVMRGELSRLRNHIRGPTAEVTWMLSDLLGLELWLQVFFGDIQPDQALPVGQYYTEG